MKWQCDVFIDVANAIASPEHSGSLKMPNMVGNTREGKIEEIAEKRNRELGMTRALYTVQRGDNLEKVDYYCFLIQQKVAEWRKILNEIRKLKQASGKVHIGKKTSKGLKNLEKKTSMIWNIICETDKGATYSDELISRLFHVFLDELNEFRDRFTKWMGLQTRRNLNEYMMVEDFISQDSQARAMLEKFPFDQVVFPDRNLTGKAFHICTTDNRALVAREFLSNLTGIGMEYLARFKIKRLYWI